MQVTKACTRSHGNIASLAASHAGLYARLTLVIVTTPPTQWAVRQAKRRKCSGPSTCQCRYKLRAGCLNEIDEEPAGRGDVGSHDHDSEPVPFIGSPLWHPNGVQRT